MKRYIHSSTDSDKYVVCVYYKQYAIGFLTKSLDVQQNIHNTTAKSGPKIFDTYAKAAKACDVDFWVIDIKHNGTLLDIFHADHVKSVKQPGIFRGTEVTYEAHGKFINMDDIACDPISYAEAENLVIEPVDVIEYDKR